VEGSRGTRGDTCGRRLVYVKHSCAAHTGEYSCWYLCMLRTSMDSGSRFTEFIEAIFG
jgi:hypothetical protein